MLPARVSSTSSKCSAPLVNMFLKMCLKQQRNAHKLKTLWKVTGDKFSRQYRKEPLLDCVLPFLPVFSPSSWGSSSLFCFVFASICAIFSLLLVLGCQCTYPRIHFHCLAGVPLTKTAAMLNSLVHVSRRDERDHVARYQGQEANNRK